VVLAVLCGLLGLAGCTAGPGQPGQPAAGTPSVPATSPASPPPTAGPDTITILGSGDVLLHPPLWAQARADARTAGRSGYDFGPLFAGVRAVVSAADVAVCHIETPVAPAGGPFIGYPRFSVPPQVIPTLAEIGYDTCSTASNHSLDQGTGGIVRTLAALDAAGIHHAGSYTNAADQLRVNLIEVHGVRIAHLSYTFSFNGNTRPAGMAWEANLTDRSAILAEAHRARAQGAAIVVVSLHWGTEYRHAPNANQLALARQLLASPDVDLILGCHAHVVQPFEQIGGKWVVYGMGNEVAHHADPIEDNREGVFGRFTFTRGADGRWRASRAEAIPVWMDFAPERLVDLADVLHDPGLTAAQRSRYQHAFDQIREYVLANRAAAHGLVVVGS
jgi:capsule synthesis protein PGA_cap